MIFLPTTRVLYGPGQVNRAISALAMLTTVPQPCPALWRQAHTPSSCHPHRAHWPAGARAHSPYLFIYMYECCWRVVLVRASCCKSACHKSQPASDWNSPNAGKRNTSFRALLLSHEVHSVSIQTTPLGTGTVRYNECTHNGYRYFFWRKLVLISVKSATFTMKYMTCTGDEDSLHVSCIIHPKSFP